MKHHLTETHEHNFEIHNIVVSSQSITLKVYNQGLQVRQLRTRFHGGPIMEVPKPCSSKYIKSVAYRGPVLWNQVKPELRCLVSKQGFASALKSHFWELYKAHHHAH